jgi:hypothetical protein
VTSGKGGGYDRVPRVHAIRLIRVSILPLPFESKSMSTLPACPQYQSACTYEDGAMQLKSEFVKKA